VTWFVGNESSPKKGSHLSVVERRYLSVNRDSVSLVFRNVAWHTSPNIKTFFGIREPRGPRFRDRWNCYHWNKTRGGWTPCTCRPVL